MSKDPKDSFLFDADDLPNGFNAQSKPPAPEALIDAIDLMEDADRQYIAESLTLALLYLNSTPDAKSGGRRAKKGMTSQALNTLAREGLLEPVRQGPVILTPDGCAAGCLTVMALLDGQKAMQDGTDSLHQELFGPTRVFRFRIELELWPEHPCWREVLVPDYFTFSMFHEVIQSCFLWWDYHCYEFTLTSKGERLLLTDDSAGGVDAMFAGFHGESGKRTSADSLELKNVFPRTRTATYVYDYGDNWHHKIRLVETIDDYKGELPCCTAGVGDAPPEDVGSDCGFEHFLNVMADPKDDEHEETTVWAKDMFFEPFSLEAVNERMRKWPTGELFDEWNKRNRRQF